MAKKSNKTLEKVYCGILIICGIGLLLSVVGLFFKVDTIYYIGLFLASPLFVVVLPACLLLMALFPVGCLYGLISWSIHKARRAYNNNRKYGTTGPAIVKGRHKPIVLMRYGGV